MNRFIIFVAAVVSAALPPERGLAQSDEVVILPPAATWEYTFSDPTADPNWHMTGGDWSSGVAPFGSSPGLDENFEANTNWPADGSDGDDLWVRRSIDLTGFELATIKWYLGVDNGFALYLNGQLVSSGNAEGYTHRWEYFGNVSAELLRPGINVVAVALEDHGGATAFDMQITGGMETDPAEKPLITSVRIVTPVAPHNVMTQVGVGESFRVEVTFNKAPDSPPEVAVGRHNGAQDLRVLAGPTTNPLLFRSDPVTIVSD